MNYLSVHTKFPLKKSYKYSRRSTKVRIAKGLLSNLVDYREIDYLKLKATCNYRRKYANEAYDVLCDLWNKLESEGLYHNLKVIETTNPLNNNSLYCFGHELIVVRGNIFMTQWLI